MPSNLFSGNASGSHTCIMVWKTGISHKKQTPAWLANWKDDGFVINKGKREPKTEDIWEQKKKEWLEMYSNSPIPYTSTLQALSSQDCWLADAWLETDYSKLTPEYFEKEIKTIIKNYLSFRIATLEEK